MAVLLAVVLALYRAVLVDAEIRRALDLVILDRDGDLAVAVLGVLAALAVVRAVLRLREVDVGDLLDGDALRPAVFRIVLRRVITSGYLCSSLNWLF